MNRIIKFRVWGDIGNGKEEFFNLHVGYHNSALNEIFNDTAFIFQQFTGCIDKNGKEIYEGDVVKAYSEQYLNDNFIGTIIFDDGSFLTKISNRDIRGIWTGDDIEVIGNIFETPELLKSLKIKNF